jgi:hypothetical protein
MDGFLKLDYFNPNRVRQEHDANLPPPAFIEKYPGGTAIVVTKNENEEKWKVRQLLR